MELKQLDALAAVAKHGRFSAAARALNTVQSNISTHIARLEDDLGAILVDRSAGELTPEGQVVLTRARPHRNYRHYGAMVTASFSRRVEA